MALWLGFCPLSLLVQTQPVLMAGEMNGEEWHLAEGYREVCQQVRWSWRQQTADVQPWLWGRESSSSFDVIILEKAWLDLNETDLLIASGCNGQVRY